MTRHDGRAPDQLRQIRITRHWQDTGEGSVLVEFGKTRVLCVASLTEGVPRWLKGQGKGWVTAEYAMLPRSTNTRSDRESVKGKIGGRTHEISRLVGRSLRAVIDTKALGENTIVLDCDVLQADGGTRTAAITGAWVALADAVADAKARGLLKPDAAPLTGSVATVWVAWTISCSAWSGPHPSAMASRFHPASSRSPSRSGLPRRVANVASCAACGVSARPFEASHDSISARRFENTSSRCDGTPATSCT